METKWVIKGYKKCKNWLLKSNQQATNKQLTTNKNDKNDKNDKNNNNPRNSRKTREYADDDPNKKLAILLLKLIRKNQNIKEPDLETRLRISS